MKHSGGIRGESGSIADTAAGHLRRMGRELDRIADAIVLEGETARGVANATARGATTPPIEAPQIRAMIRARRLRDQYFEAGIFADPAWDMLLDLTAARLEGRRVSVSSLCIAAAVPPTTGLRWIKLLTDRGMLIRQYDTSDARRIYLSLDEKVAEKMMRLLADTERLHGGN